MEKETDLQTKASHFVLKTPADASHLEFFIGTSLLTGSPQVGDEIRHEATGRTFLVTKRAWLAGRDRRADLEITISDPPAQEP